MALTLEDINSINDTTLTPELQAALLPKIETQATTYLTGKGFVVKPKADYDTEFNTALTTRQKEWADSDAPRYYGAMDKMLAAVGMPKPDGMKTREYVEKLSAEGKLPFTPEQQARSDAALKGNATPPSGGDVTSKALAEQAKKDLEDYKKEVAEKEKAGFTKTVSRIVGQSLQTAPVPVDPSLKDEAAKQAAKTAAVSDLTAVFNTLYEGAEDEMGTLYFKKRGTDAALMNTGTGQPMTPLEIIRANHRIYLAPEGHAQQGAGTGKGGTAPATGGTAADKKADAYKAAAEAGLRMYSAEWKAFIAENTK